MEDISTKCSCGAFAVECTGHERMEESFRLAWIGNVPVDEMPPWVPTEDEINSSWGLPQFYNPQFYNPPQRPTTLLEQMEVAMARFYDPLAYQDRFDRPIVWSL